MTTRPIWLLLAATVALTFCAPRREPVEPPADIGCPQACGAAVDQIACGLRWTDCIQACEARGAAVCIARSVNAPGSRYRRCLELGRCLP